MIIQEKNIQKKYVYYNCKGEKLVFIGCPPTRSDKFEWKGQIFELKEVMFYEL